MSTTNLRAFSTIAGTTIDELRESRQAAAAMDPPALELIEVKFGWQGCETLLSIPHMVLARGERVFLAGPSGSGKSTLLGIVGGILKPQSGSVRVLGTSLDRMAAGRIDQFRGDHIGYIFQSFNLLPYLSVRANVLLPLQFSSARRRRLDGTGAEHEANRLLSSLGFDDVAVLSKPVNELSVGQQQRVAAARALLGRPELLIADEPTSSLDVDNRADFLNLLMAECQRVGTSVLFVSHERSLGTLFDRQLEMTDLNQAVHAA
jgi:putative ABC transport system ATP-binding protein